MSFVQLCSTSFNDPDQIPETRRSMTLRTSSYLRFKRRMEALTTRAVILSMSEVFAGVSLMVDIVDEIVRGKQFKSVSKIQIVIQRQRKNERE